MIGLALPAHLQFERPSPIWSMMPLVAVNACGRASDGPRLAAPHFDHGNEAGPTTERLSPVSDEIPHVDHVESDP